MYKEKEGTVVLFVGVGVDAAMPRGTKVSKSEMTTCQSY